MTDAAKSDHTLRWAIAIAGIIGAPGVAMAAAGAHGADPRLLGTASTICLANAPALLALGFAGRQVRLAALRAALLTAGATLAARDLALGGSVGDTLRPTAAPA